MKRTVTRWYTDIDEHSIIERPITRDVVWCTRCGGQVTYPLTTVTDDATGVEVAHYDQRCFLIVHEPIQAQRLGYLDLAS